jgi:hypothetical protein
MNLGLQMPFVFLLLEEVLIYVNIFFNHHQQYHHLHCSFVSRSNSSAFSSTLVMFSLIEEITFD